MPRVTSQDVAKRAGVSQSTVSLVLSGKASGRVSAATVQSVEQAAAELGYRPNLAARSLRTGRTGAVGLVVPDVTNPFFGRLLRGAQREARRHRLTVALVDAANDPELGSSGLDALRTASVDGYLAFEVEQQAAAAVEEPLVALEAWDAGVPAVRFDVEDGMRQAVRHLLELGHRRIGHLASVYDTATFAVRRRVVDELVDDCPRVTTDFQLEPAREAGHALLDAAPTAVVCDDDVLASGLVLAARERALAVPRDLSVVGFDDLDLARVLDLTTVRIPAEELGARAVAALAQLMAGEPAPRSTVLPVQLVVRGSTAPPAR